ncbi:CoF synthetase [Halocynthiibacter namhaensis]|uniref:CoF synthetase n=1 Tax=Halocynthiibacter namhaensis TaxID=1290553 RepID=UPI001EE2544A|nr:CoF synthetase [Halocynthiibacter namhaensis]
MKQMSQVLAALLETLWVSRMSRPKFDRWQARRLKRWLSDDLPRVGYYTENPTELADLKITDKAIVMDQFEAFNLGGITQTKAWDAMAGSGEINGVGIGASTGTSGNRALYAVTSDERNRWLGAMLAKTAPQFLWRKERVAVILPQSSSLYDEANKSRRLRLQFFDLRQGPETWQDRLMTFDPTTITAPPRVLRHLAETGADLKPRKVFSGAETLDQIDRNVIETHFNLRLGQIYMATEGLFGVSCAHGKLHLAEDATYFEFEPMDDGLVSPLVTGFRRRFQIMARYRMNDLLRLSPDACSCGSPLRVIDEVVGRMDDVFVFDGKLITPDILRNAVLDAARGIDDFRVRREAEKSVTLVLKPEQANADALAALASLAKLFETRGLDISVNLQHAPLQLDTSQKLRRIENCWSPPE